MIVEPIRWYTLFLEKALIHNPSMFLRLLHYIPHQIPTNLKRNINALPTKSNSICKFTFQHSTKRCCKICNSFSISSRTHIRQCNRTTFTNLQKKKSIRFYLQQSKSYCMCNIFPYDYHSCGTCISDNTSTINLFDSLLSRIIILHHRC